MYEQNLIFTENEETDELLLTTGETEEAAVCTYNVNCTCGVTEPAATNPPAKLGFEPTNFVTNLQWMGIGMLVIFLVIGLIVVSTGLINKIFSRKS